MYRVGTIDNSSNGYLGTGTTGLLGVLYYILRPRTMMMIVVTRAHDVM